MRHIPVRRRMPRVGRRPARKLALAALFCSAIVMACGSSASAESAPHEVPRAELHGDVTAPGDIAALLVAAKGAPAPLCALAARAIDGMDWRGRSSDAPQTPLAGLRSQTVAADEFAGRRVVSAAELQLLVDQLGTDDRCVRELSVHLMAIDRRREHLDAVAARLVSSLASSVVAVREDATFGLGLVARAAATEPLVDALGDRAASVRANAAWALGRIADGRALRGLIAAAGDADAIVREASVIALGRLDSTRAIAIVERTLQQDDAPAVRRVAAWALAQLHAKGSASVLARVLRNDNSAAVREMSAWALGDMDAVAAVDELIDALRVDREEAVRESAAWALGEIENAKAVDALSDALRTDASVRVKGTSAWALGQLNIRTAPSGLIGALADRDDGVRTKASWALSEIRDPQSISALKTAIARETAPDARRAQLRALLRSGERSEALLSDLLRSSDASVREAAVRGLAGSRAVDPWPWPWPRPRPFP